MSLREHAAQALRTTRILSAAMRLRAQLPTRVLTVLTYHHLASPGPDYPLDPGVADASPAQFRRQLTWLRQYGTPVSLAAIAEAVAGGPPLPPNPFHITFDDGYRSCLTEALPVLRDLDIPATFFVPTAYISERRLFWWEHIAWLLRQATVANFALTYPQPCELQPRNPRALRQLHNLVKNTPGIDVARFLTELGQATQAPWTPATERALVDELLMTWSDLRTLASAGMTIQSHTHSHRVLQTVPPPEWPRELSDAKTTIERELGAPVYALAYPVGRSINDQPELRTAVAAAGYQLGFTNASGATLTGDLPTTTPRRLQHALKLHACDPLELRRLATDATMSDAMYFTQIALPPLAYTA